MLRARRTRLDVCLYRSKIMKHGLAGIMSPTVEHAKVAIIGAKVGNARHLRFRAAVEGAPAGGGLLEVEGHFIRILAVARQAREGDELRS